MSQRVSGYERKERDLSTSNGSKREMADDLSWIDHPANLRANAVLLRAVADQSLLHADELERLRGRVADLEDQLLQALGERPKRREGI